MVSIELEMRDTDLRFAFDASDLNENGINQAVSKTFSAIQEELIDGGDLGDMRVLNPEGVNVYLDSDTKRVTCTVPFMDIRVQMQDVPGVTPRAHVVRESTTVDPDVADHVCSAMNNVLTSTSPDTSTD